MHIPPRMCHTLENQVSFQMLLSICLCIAGAEQQCLQIGCDMLFTCYVTYRTSELKLSWKEKSLMNSKPAIPVRKWFFSFFPMYFVLCTFFTVAFFGLSS